ncbi:molecular chaperone TorD family protein [Candidatus Nitronereus thalassa]|uniref:Molecular chaperone TorD family protein n=1 Tax=Candidatus Nitronereus thalassa TaxID=3020898 RepID=A0ABU3KCB0_9BACT|nr:molecular chaperone TorD family protein [Candidatus Nitronereus thalassa]MDT7044155.1 molecular chaperone TorD family protein [Candidatus Nitronereus thalassa]
MATKLKESQNGVSGISSSAATSVSPLKDSPAVEQALSRSKLYLLLSWSYLYPEDDEFLDYVQSGEFVEDGRAALDSLIKVLGDRGGNEAKESLESIAKHFDEIEEWISSEGVNWGLQDLRDEHRRVFSNVIALDCPPYETLFGNDHVFGQSYVMGDISGFYTAFGLQLSQDIHERLDHLSVELEFLHFLAYKESYALCHDGKEKIQMVIDAEKKFVKEHVGRWVPLFSGMLKKKADFGFYKTIADLTSAWVNFEINFLSVNPQPYSETDYRPANYSNPEGQSFECGAQDKGNELSLLMNEVGAQDYLEKEKPEQGPSGTA